MDEKNKNGMNFNREQTRAILTAVSRALTFISVRVREQLLQINVGQGRVCHGLDSWQPRPARRRVDGVQIGSLRMLSLKMFVF